MLFFVVIFSSHLSLVAGTAHHPATPTERKNGTHPECRYLGRRGTASSSFIFRQCPHRVCTRWKTLGAENGFAYGAPHEGEEEQESGFSCILYQTRAAPPGFIVL